MKKALNPIAAIVCELVAFLLIANSSWFKNRSPIGSIICSVIGPVYFAFTFGAACMAYVIQWPERELVNLTTKFCTQEVVFIIIAILTDVFSEHHPDTFMAAAFMFVACHFHFGAHSFGVHEDFGIAQGFITVATVAALHLAKNLPQKTVVIVVGSALIAFYNYFLNKEVLRVRDTAATLRAGYEAVILAKDNSFFNLRAECEAASARFTQDLAEKDRIISDLRRGPPGDPSSSRTGLRARFTSDPQDPDYPDDENELEEKTL